MLSLRPHHLMCINAYNNKGYNDEFVENMNNIVETIKKDKCSMIKIKVGVDNVCEKCPNRTHDRCVTYKSVKALDEKVMIVLGIKEAIYTYEQLLLKLKENLNEKVIESLCSNCSWYSSANCKQFILNRLNIIKRYDS